jgi:lysophospholipase L1-like esterase
MNRRTATLVAVLALLSSALVFSLLVMKCESRSVRMQHALEAYAKKIGAPAAVMHFPSQAEMGGCGPFRQTKWFQLTWLQRRLGAWERQQSDYGAVVFVGDSIIQGWLGLDRAFPALRIANQGIMGDTSRGVLYRFKDDVLQLEPRAVVLLCGVNDLSDGASPECVAQNIKTIMSRCQSARPQMPLLVCTVLPVGADKADLNKSIRALNAALQQLAEGHLNVRIADTWTALADTNGFARASEFPDSVHPNEVGYARLEAFLRPWVDSIVTARD